MWLGHSTGTSRDPAWGWLSLPVAWADHSLCRGQSDLWQRSEGSPREPVGGSLPESGGEGPDSGRVGGQTRATFKVVPSWFARGGVGRSDRRGLSAFILSSSDQGEQNSVLGLSEACPAPCPLVGRGGWARPRVCPPSATRERASGGSWGRHSSLAHRVRSLCVY